LNSTYALHIKPKVCIFVNWAITGPKTAELFFRYTPNEFEQNLVQWSHIFGGAKSATAAMQLQIFMQF